MKKYIKNSSDPLYCGVRISTGASVKFDFENDSDTDIIKFVNTHPIQFDDGGLRNVSAYEYTSSASEEAKKIFRNYLKRDPRALTNTQVLEFIENGVLRFDSIYNLNNFSVLIHTESSTKPSIVDVMCGYIMEYHTSNLVDAEFELLKATCDEVKFDAELATQALIDSGKSKFAAQRLIDIALAKFKASADAKEVFKIKNYVPREIRAGFSEFLKFGSEEEAHLYDSLQGKNVLIYDDFYTSGTTVGEVARLLKSIHEKNTLTTFTLVKQ